MENLINEIRECILGNLPEVLVVDEDFGQMDLAENERFAYSTPAVLIGTPETEWESLSPASQRGTCTVRISLLVDCASDGSDKSTPGERMQRRRQLAASLHRLLQGRRFAGQNKMNRTHSFTRSLPGGVVVYQTDYAVMVFE